MGMNPYASPSQLGVRPAAQLSTAFLTQSFFWMFVGLLLTTGIGFFVSTLSDQQLVNLEGLLLVLIIGQLAIALGLGFAIRRIPATVGLFLFFAFAALTGVTVGFLLRIYTEASVLAAGLTAASIFGAAAFYGAVTKRSLAQMGAYLFMALIGLIVASVVNLFVGWTWLSFAVSIATVVIFTGLTAYDVQRIQRGDLAAFTGSMEKGAVMGAFALYLDFINLFFALLRLFGSRR